MMGRDLTLNELDEFDLEDLIGHGIKLIIQHEHKDDKTYANISFMSPDKDKALKASGKYIRIRDREADGPKPPAPEADASGWESIIVHIGKYKGKALGSVDEAGVTALIENWLPKAVAGGKADDAALVAGLLELQALLGDEPQY
jgi:hypothetical protein